MGFVLREERAPEESIQAVFTALAGIVLAQVLDPAMAQQIVGIFTGMGG
jgi:hypothetical protein